jgi:hypothetical protein
MSSAPIQACQFKRCRCRAGVIAPDGNLATPKSTGTERSVPKGTYVGIPACQDSQEMGMLCRNPQG